MSDKEIFQKAVIHYSKEIGASLSEEGIHKEKLVYCFKNDKSLLDYDCWINFEEKLGQSLTYDEYAQLDKTIDSLIFDIDDTHTIQLLNNRLAIIRGNFEVDIVDDFSFFDDETTYIYHYLIKDNEDKPICESIHIVYIPEENEDKSFEDLIPNVIEHIKNNAMNLIDKPYLTQMSPLMQELVTSSIESEHGMVFIDIDEYFDKEKYSDENIEQLCNEIDQLNLDNFIEVSDYKFALANADPLITVYFGVGTNFNLSEPDYLKEPLKDIINHIEQNKLNSPLNNLIIEEQNKDGVDY